MKRTILQKHGFSTLLSKHWIRPCFIIINTEVNDSSFPKYRPATLLAALVMSISLTAHAIDQGIGVNLGTATSFLGVSGDGLHVSGTVFYSQQNTQERIAFSLASGLESLPYLGSVPNMVSETFAINSNGKAMTANYVDYSQFPAVYEAYRYVKDGSTGIWTGRTLGALSVLGSTRAFGINGPGNVVVGFSFNGNTDEAFRWSLDNSLSASGGTMTGLGFLPNGSASLANGTNTTGDVVVGFSSDQNGYQAFRWEKDSSGNASGGTMTGLGYLGSGNQSIATAVNAAGTVIVGSSDLVPGGSLNEPFRWVQDNSGSPSGGTMTSLGLLNGQGPVNTALAVNADGNVVVGNSNGVAFRWTVSGGMQSVQDWLSAAHVSLVGVAVLSSANGVSASGNTVVGMGSNNAGFIASVGEINSTGAVIASGIVGLDDLAFSMQQTLALSSQIESLKSLAINGAHHRTLMDMAVSVDGSCGWVSGDIGKSYRQANGTIGIAEVGVCHDFMTGDLRTGMGVGASRSDLDLAHNGNSKLNGQYGIAEVDYRLPTLPIVASLLGTYGEWDADLKRGYALSGTVPSTGNTNIKGYTFRARLDFMDIFHIGRVSFSPRIAFSRVITEVDGYQEQGGSAPAKFDDQNHTAKETRIGLTGRFEATDRLTLLGHLESVHRFDSRGATIMSDINVLGIGFKMAQAGNRIAQDWVRVGAELDYKLNARNVLNASSFYSSAGQDADITGAITWKYVF